ncbi:MAG TPA: hypothetical protein VG860_04210 [Terriglobia bacterium]|nr:hypothetical protein [Terriglobia bacterium]
MFVVAPHRPLTWYEIAAIIVYWGYYVWKDYDRRRAQTSRDSTGQSEWWA